MDKVLPHFQLFLLLIFISLSIFFFDSLKFLNLPKHLASYLTNPVSFGLYKLKQNISKQFYFIYAARFAALESEASKKQLAELLSENANLRRKLAETEGLLIQQNALPAKTYKLLPARPTGFSRLLLIDKGLVDGVKSGQVVIFKDVLLGFITQVSPKTAQVKLLSDPDSKLAAFSQNVSGRSKGILQGQFGGEMIFDKILHEEPIFKGDLVYSEGLEQGIPRGFILGKVKYVEERDNELFKKAAVESVFAISDLDLVFIVLE